MAKTIHDVLEYLYVNGQKELAEVVLNMHKPQQTIHNIPYVRTPSILGDKHIITCETPADTTTYTRGKNKSYGTSA